MNINPIKYKIDYLMRQSLTLPPRINKDKLINIVSECIDETIIIYSPTECIYQWSDEVINSSEYRNKLNDTLRQNNSNIECIYCGDGLKIFDIFFTEECSNINIHFWPTAILIETFQMSLWARNNYKNTTMNEWFSTIYNMKLTPTINKLYKHYNNRPRTHRAIMMDNLCKNNLLEVGYNSWNEFINTDNQEDVDINIVPHYSFRYWNEELLKIDEFSSKNLKYKNIFTDDVYNLNSLFILVGESSAVIPYVTEKTYKCLLFGLPFLIYGSKNHNKELLKLGFELYDELFDYSFEELDSLDDRISGVINNIEYLKDKDYDELYKKVEPKLLRNKNRALELIKNDEFVPNFLIEYYNKFVNLE